jgi:hypothetical protein
MKGLGVFRNGSESESGIEMRSWQFGDEGRGRY